MSNGACYQPLQNVVEEQFIPKDIIYKVLGVQGFCFGASKKCFKDNMYDKDNYFDPGFSFDFNEEEFQQRNNNKNGQSLILGNAYVIHLDLCSWLKAGLFSSKKLERPYEGLQRSTALNSFSYNKYYK
jgi:hypothetical protein